MCHLDRGPKGPERRDLWSERTSRSCPEPTDSSTRSLRSLGRNDTLRGLIGFDDRIQNFEFAAGRAGWEFKIQNSKLRIDRQSAAQRKPTVRWSSVGLRAERRETLCLIGVSK